MVSISLLVLLLVVSNFARLCSSSPSGPAQESNGIIIPTARNDGSLSRKLLKQLAYIQIAQKYYPEKEIIKVLCVGSVLSKDFILTSSSCTLFGSTYNTLVNQSLVYIGGKRSGAIGLNISSVYISPPFALLRLSKSLAPGTFKAIRLAKEGEEVPSDSQNSISIAFDKKGTTSFLAGKLYGLTWKTEEVEMCEKSFSFSEFICAIVSTVPEINGKSDGCLDQVGSPLFVVDEKNRIVQFGISETTVLTCLEDGSSANFKGTNSMRKEITRAVFRGDFSAWLIF